VRWNGEAQSAETEWIDDTGIARCFCNSTLVCSLHTQLERTFENVRLTRAMPVSIHSVIGLVYLYTRPLLKRRERTDRVDRLHGHRPVETHILKCPP
jgi:hypothetical protein